MKKMFLAMMIAVGMYPICASADEWDLVWEHNYGKPFDARVLPSNECGIPVFGDWMSYGYDAVVNESKLYEFCSITTDAISYTTWHIHTRDINSGNILQARTDVDSSPFGSGDSASNLIFDGGYIYRAGLIRMPVPFLGLGIPINYSKWKIDKLTTDLHPVWTRVIDVAPSFSVHMGVNDQYVYVSGTDGATGKDSYSYRLSKESGDSTLLKHVHTTAFDQFPFLENLIVTQNAIYDTFDIGHLASAGNNDITPDRFFEKRDLNWNIIWEKNINASVADYFIKDHIGLDSLQNIYILSLSSSKDLVLTKYDKNFILQWTRTIGKRSFSMHIYNDEIFLVGETSEHPEYFSHLFNAENSWYSRIEKWSTDGNLIFAKNLELKKDIFDATFDPTGIYLWTWAYENDDRPTSTSIQKRAYVPSTPTCTGTLPTNATVYTGDTPPASGTPYTFSATNTAPSCQFSCNAGYSWSGSACNLTIKLCRDSCTSGIRYDTGNLANFNVTPGNPVTLYACSGSGNCTTGDTPLASGTWSATNTPTDSVSINNTTGNTTTITKNAGSTNGQENITFTSSGTTATAVANGICVAAPPTCPADQAKDVCSTDTFPFTYTSCGTTTTAQCPGIRNCDTNFREVAPR